MISLRATPVLLSPASMLGIACWISTESIMAGCCCFCSEKTPTALFFKYNTQLGPPYQVLVDTNFINFSIKNKVRPPGHH